jgi:hypothetical protein
MCGDVAENARQGPDAERAVVGLNVTCFTAFEYLLEHGSCATESLNLVP